MSERVPDSSGLPLRAMVMVLLFLGVIFLLLGWQALGTAGKADDDAGLQITTVSSPTATTAAAPASTAPAETRAEVRVYNISELEGLAGRTADELREAGFNVAEVTNLTVPDVAVTTVYYGDDAERATADAVGVKLGAPVEERIPALAEQPPGVVVLVAG
ncbi:LytR C-terminal domain-containing protein [Mycobacterium sp.]|uniref:LytR C-terminal domain-containing protein n=1 Tax=Mycobacterium sp. TaxID=1785 RepID=UPI003A860EDC